MSNKQLITARELYMLRKRLNCITIENAIYNESNCSKKSSLNQKIMAIKNLDGKYSVHSLCRVLGVLRSTYYHRKFRSPKQTIIEKQNALLKPEIKTIFEETKGRLGARKINVLLAQKGIRTSAGRVGTLMKEMNLESVYKKKSVRYNFVPTMKPTKDLINRSFTQTEPNKVWVSDITYLYVNYKPYYLCTIIDLFSRKVIAYNISDKMKASLAVKTLAEAYKLRKPKLGLVFHSDQGRQYHSYEFRSALRSRRILQSFSNPGCPYDNAVAESFFRSLKVEEVYRWYYKTLDDMKASIAEYIGFYNKIRPHQYLKYRTPNQFESDYYIK